jgi:hypothetical protein
MRYRLRWMPVGWVPLPAEPSDGPVRQNIGQWARVAPYIKEGPRPKIGYSLRSTGLTGRAPSRPGPSSANERSRASARSIDAAATLLWQRPDNVGPAYTRRATDS